jgi:hypothetical protein
MSDLSNHKAELNIHHARNSSNISGSTGSQRNLLNINNNAKNRA